MKTAGIVALATAASMLVACTTQPAPDTSESGYIGVEIGSGQTATTPDPGATIHRAAIESTVDGQPVTIIEFTKSCTRSGDGDAVTVSAETQGYGYDNNRNNNINTGVGLGSFDIELVGLRYATPTVKRVAISQPTGPETALMVYVANNVEGEGDTGTATAASEPPDTYSITGSAPDPYDTARTQTFTAKATCLQPPVPSK
jgi:hypothetical protein